MATLTPIDKRRLEQLLQMDSGYVLDFSNRTFGEFVLDVVQKDIFSDKYAYSSGSKANRLRAFWKEEPSHIVGKLLKELVAYARVLPAGSTPLHDECERIADRLLAEAPVVELDALEPNADGRDFEALARSVRAAIEDNEPGTGLDRLHTFTVKYVRVLCDRHGIDTSKDKPLHSLFGEYVKALRKEGLIESDMSERILRSTISILDAFNDVRNDKSLAHDNTVLGYDEALLIYNNVASSIRYISAIEERRPKPAEVAVPAAAPPAADVFSDDIPF